ncbi:cytochrome P450 [Streptomyces eurythermus]
MPMRSTTAPAAAPVVPGRFPLLGHLPQPAFRRVDFLQSVRAQGDIVRIFLGNRPVFVLNSPAAVHDVLVPEHPDDLDLHRRPVAQPSFGFGVHQCLGQQPARLELKIALPALLRRFPTLALAVPETALRFRRGSTIYGVEALPVTW